MNGQNPTNNQVTQGDTNTTGGINPSVLGSVTPPTSPQNIGAAGQAPQPTPAPTPSPVAQNPTAPVAPTTPEVTPTAMPNQPVNPQPMAQTPISPMPNVEPSGVAQIVSPEPVAQPIPGTSATPYTASSLTGNTVGVGSPTMGQDNLNANGFVEPNKVQNIGQVPPPNNNQTSKPKKKGMNKTLFVVLIIVLIAAVAFGVYYFLSASNKTTVSLKEVTVGVGEILSDNINDYATITGGNASSCTLNTRNVNTQEIGTYTFTITCDGEAYNGTVNVSDITAPEVTLNTVYKEINSTATVDEFVASCTDPSECTTTFANENTLTTYLATAGGPYSIEINATDNAGNSATYTAQLYVTPYAISMFRDCESPSSEVSGYQATKTIRDYLPMGRDTAGNYIYLGVSQRIYTYVFTNADEYTSVVGDKPQSLTFDGISGQAAYDDENLTIQIVTDLSIDTLNTEAGGTFPTNYVEMRDYYVNLQYTCSNNIVSSSNN